MQVLALGAGAHRLPVDRKLPARVEVNGLVGAVGKGKALVRLQGKAGGGFGVALQLVAVQAGQVGALFVRLRKQEAHRFRPRHRYRGDQPAGQSKVRHGVPLGGKFRAPEKLPAGFVGSQQKAVLVPVKHQWVGVSAAQGQVLPRTAHAVFQRCQAGASLLVPCQQPVRVAAVDQLRGVPRGILPLRADSKGGQAHGGHGVGTLGFGAGAQQQGGLRFAPGGHCIPQRLQIQRFHRSSPSGWLRSASRIALMVFSKSKVLSSTG